MEGIIYQINIKPEISGEHGLPKQPVGMMQVTSRGPAGDFNHYRHEKCHDDPDMAVLLFPLETIVQLNNEGWPLKAGDIGENFTTQGIPYAHFALGQHYQVGNAVVQIAKICKPCSNLKHLPYVGEEKKAPFIKTLLGRRGWYARVLQEGQVKIGDTIRQID